MPDTTIPVETAPAPVVKNEVTTPAAPAAPVVADKTQDTAVEELKKQLQQQEMRANQLANQLKTKEEADAAAKAKELEEQNQFKDLYEQEKTKREAIEAEREEQEKKAELSKAKQDILKDYSEEVRKEAEDFGFDLTDTEEATVSAFKGKLEKLNAKASTGTVRGNNPGKLPSGEEVSGDQLKVLLQTDQGFHDYVTKKFPTINSMTSKSK